MQWLGAGKISSAGCHSNGAVAICLRKCSVVCLDCDREGGQCLKSVREAGFIISLFSLLMSTPTSHSKEQYTGNHRLVKDLQHLAAHIEGSQLPQEVESAHLIQHTASYTASLLNFQSSLLLRVTPMHLQSSTNSTSSPRMHSDWEIIYLEVDHHLFGLVNVIMLVIVSNPIHKVVHRCPVPPHPHTHIQQQLKYP